jgi:hypothetical protein
VRTDLLSLQSWIYVLVHVSRLEEANKQEEELVDIAPHWGEPPISGVDVFCALLFMLFMCLVHLPIFLIDKSMNA